MAKGDDALAKKKNKAIRKRNRRAGVDTTEFAEGVKAHKRRRKLGTRRVCEGMCYSLPTPEDPFNERKKRSKRKAALDGENNADEQSASRKRSRRTEIGFDGKQKHSEVVNRTTSRAMDGNQCVNGMKDNKAGAKQTLGHRSGGKHAVDVPVVSDKNAGGDQEVVGQLRKDVSQFEGQWWLALAQGVDVLGASSNSYHARAYVVPAATQIAAHRHTNGLLHKPIVLFLVCSREQALLVRQICKPLKKALDIQSVSLHPGTSLKHQLDGLAVRTPEIIVATPDRLCQLLAVQAFSLGSVSYVVVDGMDDLISHGYREEMATIKGYLPPRAKIGILSATFPVEVVDITRNWLRGPVVRASSDLSCPAMSACITQAVTVVTTEEAKLSKIKKILEQVWKKQEADSCSGKVLVLVRHAHQFPVLMELLQKQGFSPQALGGSPIMQSQSREGRGIALVAQYDQVIDMSMLANVEVLINYDFSWSAELYSKIVAQIARTTTCGRVETLCTGAAALQAKNLIEVLEKSWQPIPHALRLLAQASSLLHSS
ncbi:unnamed protein product [Sphagnum troendelagicum]|uniref:Helicase ATP-binding domain-containing protein n=1 Tax=Sphagnum troendelagicum TaxID=128251 RepID=A0ABP0TF59_9BRYO